MMLETIVLVSAFCTADIRQQYRVMHDKQATDAQVEQAAVRLWCYGEFSYELLKDNVTGIGERRCKIYVWSKVLIPRTKRLINDLTSDHFKDRQAATDQLMDIGIYNRIIILQAMGASKDLEVRQRLQQVVSSFPD